MRFCRLLKLAKTRWQVPLAGVVGGVLASFAHWPLPWMLGSLLAVIALRCLSATVLVALPGGRKIGQWLVGSGIGLHFTREILAQVSQYGALILLGACCTLLLALLGMALLRRAGTDRPTAFFASLPGGSAEMVMLGLKYRANPAQVAAAHSLRLLLVVLLVPPLLFWLLPHRTATAAAGGSGNVLYLGLLLAAGGALALLWERLRQPNPWMLGPLCASAALSLFLDVKLSLPPGASQLGQWMIGCALGCYFDRHFFRSAPRFLAASLLATVLGMLGTLPLVWLIAKITAADPFSLTLGMMPGGIAELTLTAESLHLSVALVSALQVVRLFLLVFLAAPLYRLWSRVSGDAGQ